MVSMIDHEIEAFKALNAHTANLNRWTNRINICTIVISLTNLALVMLWSAIRYWH